MIGKGEFPFIILSSSIIGIVQYSVNDINYDKGSLYFHYEILVGKSRQMQWELRHRAMAQEAEKFPMECSFSNVRFQHRGDESCEIFQGANL